MSPVSSHFTYDNNGNITQSGPTTNGGQGTTTYTWDYQNRLTQSGGIATSTYAYDHTGARVKLTEGGTTTYFPNTLYNVSGTSTTKHIFAHGSVIATVEKNNGTATLRFITTDHLNGVNIVTDPSGNIVETLDYYPYGTIRTDTKVGSYVGEKRKFIGQEFDIQMQLSYLNARYYNGNTAKFLSQDPVFWEVGQTKDGKMALVNPQAQNSYSYAGNNPIKNSDPDGRWYKEFVTGQQSWSSFSGEVSEATQYMGSGWQTAMDHPYVTGAGVGVVGGGATYGASALLTSASVDYLSGVGTRSMGNLSKLESLPMKPTVPAKLSRLTELTGKSASQLLEEASQTGKSYIDFRNGGNINILTQGFKEGRLTRITTNPEITRIISAGTMKISSLSNNLGKGSMQSLQNTLSGLVSALRGILNTLK